jgi:hypothetical protein
VTVVALELSDVLHAFHIGRHDENASTVRAVKVDRPCELRIGKPQRTAEMDFDHLPVRSGDRVEVSLLALRHR